jgi:hypothetical protein
MTVSIELRGLDAVERYYREAPAIAREAARFAVNDAAKFGARRASEEIRKQVRFSRTYLGNASNADARLRIRKVAKGGDLEAVITARRRPTSLARFASGTPTFGRTRGRGPRVKVKPGAGYRTIKKGFFLRLRAGGSNLDQFNVGLAIRMNPGEVLRNRNKGLTGLKAFGSSKNLYLLYGPSVDQVFQTVRADIAPRVAAEAEKQFLRQFARLSRG